MDQSMLFMLAYTLSPKDAEQYATLFPQATGFRNAVQMGDELLSSLRALSMPEEQKLTLSACLISYSIVARDSEVEAKLKKLLKTIKVSQRFHVRVRENVQAFRSQLGDNSLSIVLRPPELLQKRLSELVRHALEEGEHRSRKIITDLSPKEYEHPFDRIALAILRKTKGLDFAIRTISKYSIERINRTYATGSYLRIGPRQFPEIHEMFMETCEIFDMDNIPDFYAAPGGDIEIMCLGVENPLIYFTAECFEKIDNDEQMFALGRILGTIKSNHLLYMTIMESFPILTALAGYFSGIPLFGSIAKLMDDGLSMALTQWVWASQYTLDRAGLLCCQDIDVALRCMIKMSGAPEKYYSQINIMTFKEQAREFSALDLNMQDKFFKLATSYLAQEKSGVPWVSRRAHELLKWYESGAYQQVLDRVPFIPKETPDDGEQEKSFFSSLKEQIGLGAANTDSGNFCPECGSPNDGSSKFCQQCGKPL